MSEYRRVPDERAAERLLKEFAKRRDAGITVGLSRQTVGQWFAEYDARWRRDVSERTRADARWRFAKQIPRTIRGTKLAALTVDSYEG